ncbi:MULTISPECIES: DUF924 family protein [unclassified Avibacterium]|uniref:DUF924 family protein n=1 Tax=unclassified Avibacterium TaxID=2685287 RepID=UPI00202736DB|nr:MULTISPECIES: DUF924 family protein [unclassified Avibacterium]URL01637.1 DUF924 domain-containing protein [Avibacterium sp. 20-126]MCW9699313.1 DUF924 domain-containing protein [Avibacterium sp. 20-129]MCW9733369.1 DUF924 domain-containing protein [Avibacterium sp. 20-15]URL03243.1 DUF924 domain-containing protein [Avibacterium sp. 20-132]URL06277.1 DUF924 domain-containing protein [Avibacterium sp. 21-595]
MNIATPQAVLDFWFSEENQPFWFVKSEDFDNKIREKFDRTLKAAAQGECASWRESIEGRLAEIIVLDQFSRNLYRNTPAAFAQDPMALALAQEAIKQADFTRLPTVWRKFMIMPYMHSESAFIHQQAVDLFRSLNDEYTLDFELRHKAIIDKFNRYPHRNEILNRPSTAEEIAFLNQPNSSF